MQVNIHVPAPELQSDVIAITGLAANLDRAKAGLLERVRELQAEQEDRVGFHRGIHQSRSTQPSSSFWRVTSTLATWQPVQPGATLLQFVSMGLSSGAALAGVALFSSLLQRQS